MRRRAGNLALGLLVATLLTWALSVPVPFFGYISLVLVIWFTYVGTWYLTEILK